MRERLRSYEALMATAPAKVITALVLMIDHMLLSQVGRKVRE